jgi:pimeloyl-ACP methyl ester carboxylesterase
MRITRKGLLTAGAALAAGAAADRAVARRNAERSATRRRVSDRGRPVAVRGPAGNRLHVRVHGPEDARTLVLVHCWTGTSELWHKQVRALEGELRLVTYDHRGHGLSAPAPDGDYSFDALAADLEAVLAATAGNARPLLAGHSMGAMTIAAWADGLHGPLSERAAGVALLSTGLEELTRQARVMRPLPGPFDTARGRLADAALESPFPIDGTPLAIAAAAASWVALGPDARREDAELTALMALDCEREARAGCGRSMSRLSLAHVADELDVPAIVLAGGADRMTPIAHAERIETALPRSLGLRVDPRAGHMTPLESPDLVTAALRELVAATTAGTRESLLPA